MFRMLFCRKMRGKFVLERIKRFSPYPRSFLSEAKFVSFPQIHRDLTLIIIQLKDSVKLSSLKSSNLTIEQIWHQNQNLSISAKLSPQKVKLKWIIIFIFDEIEESFLLLLSLNMWSDAIRQKFCCIFAPPASPSSWCRLIVGKFWSAALLEYQNTPHPLHNCISLIIHIPVCNCVYICVHFSTISDIGNYCIKPGE